MKDQLNKTTLARFFRFTFSADLKQKIRKESEKNWLILITVMSSLSLHKNQPSFAIKKTVFKLKIHNRTLTDTKSSNVTTPSEI